MEKELKEIKEKITDFVNKYDVLKINIYTNEDLAGNKNITMTVEV